MADSVTQLAATAVRSYGKNTVKLKPFEHIYTCNTGDLIPAFATALVNPGSTWRITTSILARLNTSRYPTMARGWIEYMWAYVPHQQIWEHWDEFQGTNNESAWTTSTTYSVPKISIPNGVTVQNGCVLDHLGIVPGLTNTKIAALTLRTYNWVCDQIARDPNIEAPFAPATGDVDIVYAENGDHTVGGTPYRINRKADYFSTCLPEPQKGPDVYLPIGTNLPVFTGSTSNYTYPSTPNAIQFKRTDGTNSWTPGTKFNFQVSAGSSGDSLNGGVADGTPIEHSQHGVYPSNLYADASQSHGPELAAVRNAFVTKHIYERNARSGTRPGEKLWAEWGVEVDPLELGLPRILDMGRFPIVFEQVEQTSATDSDSPQGTLTAFGYTNNRSNEQTFSFKQAGTIICLVALRFEHKYQYGIAQEYVKFNLFDFWDPAMAGLGDQPVYDYEIYATGGTSGTIATKSVFGYQVRGSEYRNFMSIVSGQVRSTYSTSLDYVHMADKYNSKPTLSAAWMKENPDNVDRTIFVSSEVANQWLVDFVAEFTVTDTIPLYNIPGIDRL